MPKSFGGLPLGGAASYDRRSVTNSDRIAQLHPSALRQIQLPADPFNSAITQQLQLGAQGVFRSGRVISSLPYVNWYRVQLNDGDADFPCCKLSLYGSASPIGVRDTGVIPPHSAVYIYKPPGHAYGFITGLIPELTEDGNLVCPDWVCQGGNTGFQREGYYAEMLSLLAQEGGILDFSANGPLDATCLDWGWMAETGLGVHIDPFMAYLRVNEQCGLYLFYHDQAARLAGAQLELRSLGHEEQMGEDEGEGQVFRGEGPYPWETLGSFDPKGIVSKEIPAVDVQFNQALAALEPSKTDQQPFYRYREYGGYLGQGHMREVAVPPPNEPFYTYQQTGSPALGVFREQVGLDGSYGLQSAKQIVIAKRALIPVPKRKRLATDPKGDNPDNYKAAGFYGSGPEHKVTDVVAEGDNPHVLAAAAIRDVHAYLFNWKGLHPFHYHGEDYEMPEQDDLAPLLKLTSPLGFSDLQTQMFLPAPVPKKVIVDHRYGETAYYETASGISLLEDGGVVIADGYGGEIRMTGGSIFISCPGDVFLQPGRNVVQMAGHDVILRARNSIDLTTTEKDVRIKAENNLQMLGGAGGEGGVLIESKANSPLQDYVNKVGEDVQSSGVVLKAAHSEVVAWGQEVYLRTGSSDGNAGSGPITLDADRGRQAIRTVSSRFDRYIENTANDTFGIEQPAGVNQFSAYANSLTSRLYVNGGVEVARNGMIVNGQISIVGGSVASEVAGTGHVGQLQPQGVASIYDSLDRLAEASQNLKDAQLEVFNTSIQTRFYAEGRVGNSDVQKSLAFSLRTVDQYHTSYFQLPESSWQQLAAAAGSGTVWRERAVTVGNQDLLPYPGREPWKENSTLLRFAHTLFDAENGIDKPRSDAAYSDPKLGSLEPVIPNEHYLVI